MSQHTDKGAPIQHFAERPQLATPASDRSWSEVDELHLVRQAQAGEQEAFGLLVQRHGKAVLNLIDKMVRDRTIVEDLWQETFVRALENLHTYEPRTSTEHEKGPSFVSWLYRIASNLTLDELRRRSRWRMFSWSTLKPRRANEPESEEGYDPPADQPDAVALLASQEDIKRVRQALDTLAPEWRMMLVMREYQDLPYEDIAEILNIPIGTVRSRLARAREQLRLVLEKQQSRRAAV